MNELTPVPFVQIDAAGVIAVANTAAERLLMIRAGALVGTPLEYFLPQAPPCATGRPPAHPPAPAHRHRRGRSASPPPVARVRPRGRSRPPAATVSAPAAVATPAGATTAPAATSARWSAQLRVHNQLARLRTCMGHEILIRLVSYQAAGPDHVFLFLPPGDREV